MNYSIYGWEEQMAKKLSSQMIHSWATNIYHNKWQGYITILAKDKKMIKKWFTCFEEQGMSVSHRIPKSERTLDRYGDSYEEIMQKQVDKLIEGIKKGIYEFK